MAVSEASEPAPLATEPPTSAAEPAAEDPGPASALPEPKVSFERPYKLFERPRPKGEVYAAGQDELLARWNVGGNGDPKRLSSSPSFHPGARVIVNVKTPVGALPKRAPYDRRRGRFERVLSETAVLAQARKKGYWPFRLCFEEGLRRDQRLHGTLELALRVTKSGRPRSARQLRERLPDDAVRRCLAERARALEFSPGPRQAIDVELSIELWPGDAPVPLTSAPSDAAENPGELDASLLERASVDAREAVTRCYAAGLARDPALWGRLQLQVDLDERGRTRRVRETESRFPDAGVSTCVTGVIRAIRFPAAKGGALSFVFAVRFGELQTATSTDNHT